jgi:hypothetical protein
VNRRDDVTIDGPRSVPALFEFVGSLLASRSERHSEQLQLRVMLSSVVRPWRRDIALRKLCVGFTQYSRAIDHGFYA